MMYAGDGPCNQNDSSPYFNQNYTIPFSYTTMPYHWYTTGGLIRCWPYTGTYQAIIITV
jgi:hypothetical protein